MIAIHKELKNSRLAMLAIRQTLIPTVTPNSFAYQNHEILACEETHLNKGCKKLPF